MAQHRIDATLAPVQAEVGAAANWQVAARRAGTHSLIVWSPIAFAWVMLYGVTHRVLAFDFVHAYLPAAKDIVAGRTPYPPVSVAVLARGTSFVYPPLLAILLAPLSALPTGIGAGLAMALSAACLAGVLLVLGVRDWRCYLMALAWLPVGSAIQNANINVLLALGFALAWRYRDRAVIAAIVVGALVALKLFAWPLAFWLLATRRYRAAIGSLACAAALIFVPWAFLGFSGLMNFPHLLEGLSSAEQRNAYTVAALLGGVVPWSVASAIGIAVGVAVLVAAVRAGRRDDLNSFTLAIGAALLLTPIVWLHYLVFLIPPLAIRSPRLGWRWALPLVLWVVPAAGNGATWQTAFMLAIGATMTASALHRPVSLPAKATTIVTRLRHSARLDRGSRSQTAGRAASI